MPYTTDITKGPFDLLAAIPNFTKGDYEKGAQNIVSGLGFAGYAFGRYFAKEATTKLFGTELVWLWRGIIYIQFLQLFWGPANDSGSKYGASATQFELVYRSLKDAMAVDEDSWSGEAAEAYNQQNSTQMTRVSKPGGDLWHEGMKELDSAIKAVLARESEQVKSTNMDLNWLKVTLIALIPICSALAKSQPQISYGIQVAAVTSCVISSAFIIGEMNGYVFDNSNEVYNLAKQYRRIADNAAASLKELVGDSPSSTVAQAKTTKAGQFDTLNTTTPFAASSFTAAETATSEDDKAAAVAESNAAGGQFAPPLAGAASAASTGVGGSLGVGLASASSEAGTPATGGTPAYTMPTASQVSQASTQAAKASQQAASVVNQTLGTVGQASSMASSGSGAPGEPAAEQGAVAEDVEEAAAGTGDAERAPVGVGPVGTEQAQQPSPAERTRTL